MDTKERIKKIIEANGVKSISQFEKSISVANGYVNNIRSDISTDVRDKILEVYPRTSKMFLAYGEGDPLIPENSQIDDKTIQNLAEALLKANTSNEKLVEQNGKVLDRIITNLDALVQASISALQRDKTSVVQRVPLQLDEDTDEPQTTEESSVKKKGKKENNGN